MTMPMIPIADLERSINRARSAHPASGSEASLSSDVALLGALYGRLIYRNRVEFAEAELTDMERMALARWR
ncbi:MAG: DUF3717 domain-containing protein [Lautropia sp.]